MINRPSAERVKLPSEPAVPLAIRLNGATEGCAEEFCITIDCMTAPPGESSKMRTMLASLLRSSAPSPTTSNTRLEGPNACTGAIELTIRRVVPLLLVQPPLEMTTHRHLESESA